jgi:AcrR family transcriptional regulator
MTSSSDPKPGRSGRRPGRSGTREAVAAAAIEQFAELGYERTTIRSVARSAGVDPALVLRFHGSKDALFRDVMQIPATAEIGRAHV